MITEQYYIMDISTFDDAEENIKITREDDWWLIHHKELNITTQGETRLHAILMLADAIAAYEDSDEDLVELSKDVFIPDEEMLNFIEEYNKNPDNKL